MAPGVSESSEAPTNDLTGLRILVAEDNEINQLLALRLLEKQNHIVTTVGNGQEALDAIDAGEYDCVLMDMEMPILDGIETTRIIREKEADSGEHLAIIAMTANAMQGDEEDCLQAGMDGYISKPVDLQSLYEVLDRLVARPEVQEEQQQLFVESVPESISDVSESETDADADTSVEAEADQVVAQLSEADEDAIGADGSPEEASEIGSDDYVQSTDQMPESDDSEATSEGEAVGLLDSDAPVDEPASEAAVNASEADSSEATFDDEAVGLLDSDALVEQPSPEAVAETNYLLSSDTVDEPRPEEISGTGDPFADLAFETEVIAAHVDNSEAPAETELEEMAGRALPAELGPQDVAEAIPVASPELPAESEPEDTTDQAMPLVTHPEEAIDETSIGDDSESVPDITAAVGRFGNEGLFVEIARQFLVNYPELMLSTYKGIEDEDHESVRLITRSLKDLLGMFGAYSAYNLALKLEMMAHAGDVSEARPVFDELEREMLLLAHAIKRAIPVQTT